VGVGAGVDEDARIAVFHEDAGVLVLRQPHELTV
jgi:hypothetical protein